MLHRRIVRVFVVCLFFLAVVELGGHLVTGVNAQQGASRPSIPPRGPLFNSLVNALDTTEHDTQSTTAILKIPGTTTVVAAFNNSAVYACCNGHLTGWSRSTNNGATWTDGGSLPASAFGDGGDPVLARDDTSGTIYLSTKAFTGSSTGVPLFRSTTDGASWTAPVNAMPGFGGGDLLDTPRVTVDNFAGTGAGYVYVAARNVAGGGGGSQPSGVYLSRSIDGGATFTLVGTPSTGLSPGGTGPTVVVGTDHAVYVFWWINLSPAVIRFSKSTNLGVSWGPFTTAATLSGTGANGDLGLGGGFRTNSFPQAVVDPISGAVGFVYNDKNGTDKGDIFIVGSTNGGVTWDAPERVNNDATTRDQFMPSIGFTRDGKHFMVSWYDRRSDPGNSLIERWGIILTKDPATGNCCSVSPNFRVSSGSWPAVVGQDSYVPGTYMGDYDQMSGDVGAFFVAWGDNRAPNPGTGPLPHTNQPDVRFQPVATVGPPQGDFDRDFQTDRTVFRPSTGAWYSSLSGGGATGTGFGAPGDIDVPGDYDGDGKTDLAVFRPSNGFWFITQSSDGTGWSQSFGTTGDIPMAGDVDGDGKDDLVVWRPSNGAWFISPSSSPGSPLAFGWGTTGDRPMLGDYNGDGASDLAVWRPSTGGWYVFSPFTGPQIFGWGTTGDIPVAGDFDGDGKADACVFRPSTGAWFVRRSSDLGTTAVSWGTSGDVPVSGDWNGDTKSDFTVWRESSGAWFSQLSGGGSTFVVWGTTGDKPSGRLPGT